MRATVAVSLFVLALAVPAVAQQPAPADSAPASGAPNGQAADLGSSVVEALEVVAPAPGPALWRVTKGDSEVIVLGAINPLPHSLAWDANRVNRALDGATELLDLAPKPKLGGLDMLKFAVSGQGKGGQGKPLEQTLPEPLRTRFIAARTAAQKGESRYANDRPYMAGIALINDYRLAAGLSNAKPSSTLKKLAASHGVPVVTPLEYRIMPLVSEASKLSEVDSLACLTDAVDQVQMESDHAQPAANAWAAGDLKGVRANYSEPPLEKCLRQVPSGPALLERGTTDSTRAIVEALNRPGRTVAVVDMNFLLRPNGVLDRLKAQGAEITVPPG